MATKQSEALVLVTKQNGVVIIPSATPLTRLNYFDGKFLRASDLKSEQDYLRHLVRQSNQSDGPGVAHGFDLTLGGGDTLAIGPGLAIDPAGRVLLLPQPTSIGIQELIDKSRDREKGSTRTTVARAGTFERCELVSDEPGVSALPIDNVYLIVLFAAEALCGEEDVFGKLCEEACVTSTDRPYVVEGVIVRAIPLVLQTQLFTSKAVPLTQIHLRSRVASAYFEDERKRVGSLISKFGLEQETWCLGADAAAGFGVPIGVVARAGTSTAFLDVWTARREKIDTPARRYWQWRMMMRPWDVFLAQILQFQCQLRDLLRKVPELGGPDPCGGARTALTEAATAISELRQFYEITTSRFTSLVTEGLAIPGGVSRIADLNKKLMQVSAGLALGPKERVLIRGGIIELPSAGYLPVVPGADATINQQVRQMLGEGLDLRFCLVRPDYVAHALEAAQHMERISLLQGLDNPDNKPQVDILVPNGEILTKSVISSGFGFEATVNIHRGLFESMRAISIARPTISTVPPVILEGAARASASPTGGGSFHLSSLFEQSGARLAGRGVAAKQGIGVWLTLSCERNVLQLKVGDATNFNARATLATSNPAQLHLDISFNGVFQITNEAQTSAGQTVVKGHIENAQLSFSGRAFGENAPKKTILVDLDATVVTKRGPGPTGVSVIFHQPQTDWVLFAEFGQGSNNVVRGSIIQRPKPDPSSPAPPPETTVLETALKPNPEVLSTTNPNHAQAVDALELIGAVLQSPTFADASQRLLFPSPPKPTDDLEVRGTLDWVLFHRRRTKQCSEEVIAPERPRARRYQVFAVVADGQGEVTRLMELARSGEIPANRLQPVAIAGFEGGVATLITRSEDLLKDWRTVNPGNTIVYAAIANRESAASDGEPLSRSRLSRVEAALASASTRSPSALEEFVTKVPPTTPAGLDGAITFITLNQIVTTGHSVFRTSNLDALLSAIQNNGLATALGGLAVSLGDVNFTANTANPANDDSMNNVIQKWNTNGGGVPRAAIAVTVRGDLTIPQALALQQSGAIVRALGGTATGSAPQFVESPSAFPPSVTAPVATFVVGQVRRTGLVVFSRGLPNAPGVHVPERESARSKIRFTDNVPENERLIEALRTGVPPGTSLGRIRGVTLVDLGAPLDPDAQTRANGVLAVLRSIQALALNVGANATLLSPADKEQLEIANVDLGGIDDVIFIELAG